jgi:SAM-dependent methyltransferase
MSNNKIISCLACGSNDLYPYIDLGYQALANDYVTEPQKQPSYPLAVNMCKNCYHSQLGVAVDPDLLYKNYLYVSGTSTTLQKYFEWFVTKVENGDGRKLSVLDIASNDGSLLAEFRKRGHSVLGVDPATNLMPLAALKGVETINNYWTEDFARTLDKKFDVVVSMNVLAHNADPLDFVRGVTHVLNPEGRFFVQTSQSEIFRNFEFDTIYHEHHSFFTTRSFRALFDRCGLNIANAEKVPVHGNSYLVEVKKEQQPGGSKTFDDMMALEDEWNYFDMKTYADFQARISNLAEITLSEAARLRSQGFKLVGYGAAAKANTFLNYSNLALDYIIDENPMKIGLYTPGRNIEIKGPNILATETNKLAIFITAWNFSDEIVSKVKTIRNNQNDTFFTYFPSVRFLS